MIKVRRSDIIDTANFEQFCRTQLGVKEDRCSAEVLRGVLRLIADEEDDGYGSSMFNPVDVEEFLTLPLKMLQRYCTPPAACLHWLATHCYVRSFLEPEAPRYPEVKAGRPGRSEDTAAVVSLMTKVRASQLFCIGFAAVTIVWPSQGTCPGDRASSRSHRRRRQLVQAAQDARHGRRRAS